MRRRRFLALLPVGAAGAFCACTVSPKRAEVRLSTRTPNPLAATPTPTQDILPPPELILSTESTLQGGAILVSLVGQLADGNATFLERTLPLAQGARSIYAFMPVGTDDPSGLHTLEVDFTLANGSRGSLTQDILIDATTWTQDAVVLGPEQSALLDPNVTNLETDYLTGIYSGFEPAKLWDGTWNWPVFGDVTTRFGEERSYNGGPFSGHHSGTDIGAALGLEVGATNHGRIVMARQLQLRGNMVVIDHGGGLFSGYAHLDSFAVTEGQEVASGDIIGYVGSTGLSTGPHLHWEIASHGVVLDPQRFAEGSNGF